ncbi:peroxisomal multifunctional enzyme type 2 isoform X3 [Parasteatoda tepidariorum]|uniref:peroxisomal multifunctional enzyme type 2 isoform X3 n=1 Tax=Parasteatoda tepidariorum TaxID=114398 RepID=UPI001C71B482|nr:peroxisomal multifunctional enzyme type 2-like [Parasteatoda tepidariorum]
MGPLKFAGKVAIVTGAGGGLGREYALLLAERGASVVVNDLGGTRSGEGKSSSAADAVVKEIKAKGGKAVPNYDSVEEGEKIVKTAIDKFGRLDILINNAGILRDKSFLNITNEEWDIIHKVHLRGSFMVTKAAWPYFRKQGYGRIIMTASGAGIYGNFGQSNYSSAKLGLIGLSNTLAIEGKKYNIHCNTIVPIAASRLTQDILPPDIFDQLKPSCVSPVVAWLCHESCPDTGAVIEAAGGWVGKYQWQRSIGKAFIPPSTLTIEAVRDNWSSITDMTDFSNPSNLQEQTVQLMESLTGGGAQPKVSKRAPVDPDSYCYDQDKAILYALAGTVAIFFFFFCIDLNFFVLIVMFCYVLFDMLIIFSQLLHGEQYLELYKPLQPEAVLKTKCRLLDILDKGSGAVAIVEAETFNESNELVMRSEWTIFLVGAGNFGGKRSTDKAVKVASAPNRKPDAVLENKTSVDQAALYRLCGDKNPIHIDPAFAAMGGFPEPILHGLCSLGYSTRHVLKQFANYDVNMFKSVMARFANPIIPGHTLRTEMWKEGSRIHFESSCVETGKKIISGGYIDLLGVPKVASFQDGPVTSNPASALKSKLIFKTMSDQLAQMPELAQKIQAVYEWNILQNGKTAAIWTVDLKTGSGRIVEGTISGLKPGVTLTIDDEDMFGLVTGKLDPQKAFMGGKLKLKGNIMLTQKLKPLLEARKNVLPQPKVDAEPAMKCDKIFMNLGEKLKKNPDLAASIKTVYQWNILKSGKHVSTWTLDLKNGSGAVYKGTPKHDKPDCTFILEDELFTKIMDGSTDPQRAFMSGKLKITGNVLASQKLQAIWENPEEEEKMSFAPASDDSNQSFAEMPARLKSDFIFLIFAERLGEEPELAQKMKVVYNWNILQGGKKISEWTVDLKSGAGSIYRGSPKNGKADVMLTMEDEDVILMMLGKLNPQRAFMTGRLKIKGNIMLTQKLNQLWQEILKSGRAVELPILSAILADKPFDPSLRSEPCFVELGTRVARKSELVKEFDVVVEWNVTKNGKKETQWIMDLKTEKGMLSRGPAKNGMKPSIFITVDDDIFADWILHKIQTNQVLSAKTTEINGDKSLVYKLLDSFKLSSKL